MNKDYLISKIAEQLNGKKIERNCYWKIEYQIKDTMIEFFDKNHFENIWVEKDRHANLCFVKYKRHYLFGLKYTKTKGENHYSCFGTYTDYFYKDFSCCDQEEDFELETKMKEIDDRVVAEELAKDKLFKEMTENYKKVVALFGDKTSSVLLYIEKHRYELEREIRDEKK